MEVSKAGASLYFGYISSSFPILMVCCQIINLFVLICREGFEQSRIDALLHRIELSQKHQTSNFGLQLTFVSHSNYSCYPKYKTLEFFLFHRENICVGTHQKLSKGHLFQREK